MSIHKPKILLAILVATSIFFIFSNARVISKELPIESKTDTLDPSVSTTETPLKTYAKSLVIEQWGIQEWESFEKIINKESSWTHNTEHYPMINGKRLSSATGLAGFLNATWDDVGCVKTYDKREQVRCGIKYVEQRYGSPQVAWNFHLANNYY